MAEVDPGCVTGRRLLSMLKSKGTKVRQGQLQQAAIWLLQQLGIPAVNCTV